MHAATPHALLALLFLIIALFGPRAPRKGDLLIRDYFLSRETKSGHCCYDEHPFHKKTSLGKKILFLNLVQLLLFVHKMRLVLFVLAIRCTLLAEDYRFAGKHFLASYLDCDADALGNVEKMQSAMDQAVEASGATILNCTSHRFEPNALTVVYLLSESHASIHTYPEHGACFVDIFTCGDHCSPEWFDAALQTYLQPKKVHAKLFLRHEKIEEITTQASVPAWEKEKRG